MRTERNLTTIAMAMFALNFSILAFYSLICVTTTFRICETLGAQDFLNSVRQIPQYPWQMPVRSLCLYALLCGVSYFKNVRPIEYFPFRVGICVMEIALCAGILGTLDFYYNGVALLVLADLVHYIRNNKMRLMFIVILSLMFAFGRYEIMERIRKLNEQLNQANDQLRDYAVNMERMTQMRERNRLAREIHDTLGHTLTGIIMGADAGLALFDVAPEESKKRIQIVAQSARDGLTDVRRSIKALRPDALERSTLAQALEGLVENFRLTTSAQIAYFRETEELELAQDEEDALYRVVQEGLTNAVRHGRAERIEIRISRAGDVVSVNVRDNGTGSPSLEEGFGLRHMRERLEMLGGTLRYGNLDKDEEDGYTGFYITACLHVRNRKGE